MRLRACLGLFTTLGSLAALGGLCAACAEQHIHSEDQLPTKNLRLYRTADLSRYLSQHGCPLKDFFEHISTNESGTAIFVTDSRAMIDHTSYVLSEGRDDVRAMKTQGIQSAYDEDFQATAWVESRSYFEGPVHFATGYTLVIDDPVFTQGGFDTSGHYFWMATGPGTQYRWDSDPADDSIQIRDTRHPEEPLVSVKDRFMPLQLFSHNGSLYLFGRRHRDNSYPPDSRVCMVFGQEGGQWSKQKEFEIPLEDWHFVECRGIDQGSDFALLCDIKDFVPIPFATIEWHLLNLKDGKMLKLDFLDAEGWDKAVEATTPLFLRHDFLSERLVRSGPEQSNASR